MIPGEIFPASGDIELNTGLARTTLLVANSGDRPIQVGSHTHFFESNKALEFPRKESYGFHLNIAAGTSVRFEPGETKSVELTEYGGKRIVFGFSGLVNGPLSEKKSDALEKAKKGGFQGA